MYTPRRVYMYIYILIYVSNALVIQLRKNSSLCSHISWVQLYACLSLCVCVCVLLRIYSKKMRLYAFFFYIWQPKKCVHVEFLIFRDVVFVHQTRSRRPLLCTNRGQTIEFWFSTTFVSFSRRALCKKCNFLQLFPQQPHTGRPHKNCTRDVWAWRMLYTLNHT